MCSRMMKSKVQRANGDLLRRHMITPEDWVEVSYWPEEASSLLVTTYCRGQAGGWRLDASRPGRWLEA